MSRPRVSLKNLMIGLAFLACILALFGVNRLAESRERDLRLRLAESKSREFALQGMTSLLTDRGIDILKQATDAELLQVFRPSRIRPSNSFSGSVVTPADVRVGEAAARRMACVLLDYRNYAHIGAGDMPDPQFGLRYRGVSGTLDVLVDAVAGATDQHFWIEIRDASEKVVHKAGPHCMDDPALQKLAATLLAR